MSYKNKSPQKKGSGCGCWTLLLLVGFGVWLWPRMQYIDYVDIEQFSLNKAGKIASDVWKGDGGVTPVVDYSPSIAHTPDSGIVTVPAVQVSSNAVPMAWPTLPAEWASKEMRGIYLSRYMATNRASEQMIRDRVRFYKAQGINTIIHGVWGNGCTMYKSEVMMQTWGYPSCPNQFQDEWLDWLIDEAHRQGMQVHAYFEKGIKLDKNSPIFDLAVQRKWFVPGVDRTYASVDHYLLDVENPDVVKYFHEIQAEFVRKYPTIDAVQWDDYLGYHEELSGGVDRTKVLTRFAKGLQKAVKQTNPNVSFDVCHHNPYWGKRYFDADWKNWDIDRGFIQVYNDENFEKEMEYVSQVQGIAVSDAQFGRLNEIAKDPRIKSVFLFPSNGNPKETAAKFKQVVGVK